MSSSHRAALSDDLQQPQTVCIPCRRALLSRPLALPKHIDLWMGRCPPGLVDIAEGTQRLCPADGAGLRSSDCVATCHGRSNAAAEGHDRQHHLRATGDAVAGLQGVAAAHGRRAGALDICVGRPREAQLERGSTAASATGGVRDCRAQLARTIAVLQGRGSSGGATAE